MSEHKSFQQGFEIAVLLMRKEHLMQWGFYNAGTKFGRLAFPGVREKLEEINKALSAIEDDLAKDAAASKEA